MTATTPAGPLELPDSASVEGAEVAAAGVETPWRRLSLRMLAVHPVIELVRALPAVVALLIVGSQQRNGGWWAYIGIAVPVVIGLIRWATTRYRITPAQIQVRRGLLGRSVRTVPRDRVRSVDLTSHLMHRLLGLTKVSIGTGQVDRQKDSGLVLDGLSTTDAARLREELLHSRRLPTPSAVAGAATSSATVAATPSAPPVPDGARVPVRTTVAAELTLARLDPAWIRYGPFTLSGLLTIGVVAGFAWRTINEAHLNPDKLGPLHALTSQLASLPMGFAAAEVVVLGLLLIALASTVAYVMAFWNFTLTRTASGTLHVSRGLLTTRSTTIEERRLRGVEISEPLLLRAVGAARCTAITTGLRYGRGAERGGSLLLPPAPAHETRRVGAHVLRSDTPLTVALVAHPRAAARRRINRALLVAVVLVGLAGALSWAVSQPAWVVAAVIVLPPCAVLLAKDRFRNLGHATLSASGEVGSRVVFGLGSAVRRRYVIDSDGVIGWKIRQSFFQRRAGLVTLTATTAAGRQHYALPDVDTATAITLADEVLPSLLTPFLTPA